VDSIARGDSAGLSRILRRSGWIKESRPPESARFSRFWARECCENLCQTKALAEGEGKPRIPQNEHFSRPTTRSQWQKAVSEGSANYERLAPAKSSWCKQR
jgi:hypothetical protein